MTVPEAPEVAARIDDRFATVSRRFDRVDQIALDQIALDQIDVEKISLDLSFGADGPSRRHA